MAIAVVALIGLPWLMELPFVNGYSELATRIVIWAIFALGFDILVGFTGYLSFGHAAFWGIGAYVCGFYMLHATNNVLVAMAVGVVVVAVVALLMGLISLRRHGIYFAILTLAFAEMAYYLALAPLSQWTGGDNGLTGIPDPSLAGISLEGNIWYFDLLGTPFELSRMHLFVVFWAALLIYLARRILRSPFGLVMQSIKSNETRLTYTGVSVYRYKLMAFVISGVFAGVAGTLSAAYQTYVPTHSLHWTTSGEVIVMSVIGGFGTLVGPMLGAGIVLYLENVLSGMTAQWLLIQGLIFIFFVIFLPGGIMDGLDKLAKFAAAGFRRLSGRGGAAAKAQDPAVPSGSTPSPAELRQESP